MKRTRPGLTLLVVALAAAPAAAQVYDVAGNVLGAGEGMDDPPGTKLLEYRLPVRPGGLTRIGDLFYGISNPNIMEFDWRTGTVLQTTTLSNMPTFRVFPYGLGFDSRRNLFVLGETVAMGIMLADRTGKVTAFFSTAGTNDRNVGAAYDSYRDGYWITAWNTNRLTLYDARNLPTALRTIDLKAVGATRAAGTGYSPENDVVYTSSRDTKKGYAFDAATGALLYSWPLVYQGTNNAQGAVWWDRWNAAVVVDLETSWIVFTETGYPRIKASDTVKVGTSLPIAWIAANSPGNVYKGAASFTERTAGIVFLNRYFPLAVDSLFLLSLAVPTIFSGFEGALDLQGTAAGAINVPNLPALSGLRFSIAFVTVDARAPFGIDAISGAWKIKITT